VFLLDTIVEHIKKDIFLVDDVNTGKRNVLQRFYKEESDKAEYEQLIKSWKELVEEEELVCEYVEHFHEGRNACLFCFVLCHW
jgi:hypothetical protein